MKFLREGARKEDVSRRDRGWWRESTGTEGGGKEVRQRRKRSGVGKKEARDKKKVARDGG